MIAIALYSDCWDYFVRMNSQLVVVDDVSQISRYEKCVVCDNEGVSNRYAFQVVLKCLSEHVDVLCFFRFSEEDERVLSDMAKQEGTKLRFVKEQVPSALEIQGFDKPVLYIAGEGNECDQLEAHSVISSILSHRGYKVLNASTSAKATLLGYTYLDVSSLSSSERGREIQCINKWIAELMSHEQADVLVLSNIEGVTPFNEWDTSSYGVLNHYLKYAVPFDFVFYCVYCNYVDSLNKDELRAFLKGVFNEQDICFVASKHCYDRTNMIETVFRTDEDDYIACWKRLQKQNENGIVFLCDEDGIERYLEGMGF